MHFFVQGPWFYSVACTEFNPSSPRQKGSILTQTPTKYVTIRDNAITKYIQILLIASFAQHMESYPSTPPAWDFQREGYGQNHPQTPRRNGEANSDDLNLQCAAVCQPHKLIRNQLQVPFYSFNIPSCRLALWHQAGLGRSFLSTSPTDTCNLTLQGHYKQLLQRACVL